jgi:type IV pilus assembly protein PilP
VGTEKKRIHIMLVAAITMGAVALFFGLTTAQTGKQTVFKIPKEEKKTAEPAQKTAEPTQKTPGQKPKKAKAIEAKPEPDKKKEETSFSYDPTNKPDPFKSFITVREELEEKEEREKPKTYLETLDISQLVISAIVLTNSENWALVRDSKGDGHVIKVGTPIGRSGGRVTEIHEDKVVVKESYKDFRGREIVRERLMKLPELD